MTKSILITLATLLISGSAFAAAPDLVTDISVPAGVHVYENGTYNVTVSNVGNKHADSVSLTIQLPETATSPTVYVLGTLGGYSSECIQLGTTLDCDLGRIRKNRSKSVSFDLEVPYSIAPILIDATADTAGEGNPADNSAGAQVDPLTYSVSIFPPENVVNEHCTGQNLISFWDCVVSPGSISSHNTQYLAGGEIAFPNNPGYTGNYVVSEGGHRLQFDYYDDLGNLTASFDGYGVDADCWEGATYFPGSPWMSMYRVCLQ